MWTRFSSLDTGSATARTRDIYPIKPLVSEVRLDQLQDREWRYLWFNKKVRWSIAVQIRTMRLEKGWTQEELGRRIGSYAPIISQLENPESPSVPQLSTLCKIAHAFDCALIVTFIGWRDWLAYMRSLEECGFGLPASFEEEIARSANGTNPTDEPSREEHQQQKETGNP
jgi:transcriptional regulator with XRE-family HTH domain